jgi:hypothetical protein
MTAEDHGTLVEAEGSGGLRSYARPSGRFGTSDITPARCRMFGPQMRMALEKYQLAEKPPVTGQLDAETMERLDVYKRLFSPDRAR